MADDWKIKHIHRKLDEFAQRFFSIVRHFGVQYHWSLDQAEYATDIVFRRQADLQPLYAQLTRTAIHARSEERRVGKECRSRWTPYAYKINNKYRERYTKYS